MTRHFACLFAFTSILLSPLIASAAPLEAYARLPALFNVTISSDGKQLAYITDVDGKRSVIVYAIDSANVVTALNLGTNKLKDLRCADKDQLLITASQATVTPDVTAPKEELTVTQVFSVSSNRFRPLVQGEQDSQDIIRGVPQCRTVDGHTMVFVHGSHFVNGRRAPALFSIDLDSGSTRLIETGPANSKGWLVDESGNVVAAIEYDATNKRWSLNIWRNEQWVKVYDVVAAIETPHVEGFSSDGQSLILKTIKNGQLAIERLKLSDGTLEAPTNTDTNTGIPIVDTVNHRIIGHETIAERIDYVFSSKTDQEVWNSVSATFADEIVKLASWSADRKRVVVHVDGMRDGSEFELVDLNTSVVNDLGPAYEDIGAPDVAEVKFMAYAASDGRKIPAFVTLPRGRPPSALPLVLLAHGGPADQDRPGFDWWAQALASRGYVVLQPEFRGSNGFGWRHLSAGFGEWGRKMQMDLSDGVRFLASQGLIDPKRVCIVGASYGGYAALAGPTLDRGVYRCAVAVAGLSDPHKFLDWKRARERAQDSRSMRFWMRFMGVESYDDPKLADISPLSHATDADAPILLIHGSDDTAVPIAQSEDMERALRSVGKPVTFVRLNSEDHWLSHPETREQMLLASVAFLEANNPSY